MPRIASALAAVPVAASLALAVVPATLAAQRAQMGVFTAANRSIGGAPLFGVSLGGGGSATGMGVRVSGAVRGLLLDSTATFGMSGSGFTSDVDMTYDSRDIPGWSLLQVAFGGFAPNLLAGAGVVGRRDSAGAMRIAPVFNLGAGVSRELAGALSVETEARYRRAIRNPDGTTIGGLQNGWEYRAGLSLRFGGGGRRTPRGGATIPGFPFPIPTGGDGGGATSSARASAVLSTADDYLGTPYVYGGTTPRGFDCSGFTQYVFRRHDVQLPRTSRQQAQVGRAVSPRVSALRAGDLMLFSAGGDRIDHVAIYAGNNRIIHSSSSGNGVRYDDLGTDRGRWFVSKMVAARRVVSDGRSLVDALDVAALLGEAVRSFDPPDRAPRPR